MKKILLCLTVSLLWMAAPAAAETWKGTLSDSMCAAKHSAEKQGENAKKHQACVEKCTKGGEKFVFVSGDKVYTIANQDFADLKAHGGHAVTVTGELKGEAITVSKIEMAPEKK
jgi:hypothetical protein